MTDFPVVPIFFQIFYNLILTFMPCITIFPQHPCYLLSWLLHSFSFFNLHCQSLPVFSPMCMLHFFICKFLNSSYYSLYAQYFLPCYDRWIDQLLTIFSWQYLFCHQKQNHWWCYDQKASAASAQSFHCGSKQ